MEESVLPLKTNLREGILKKVRNDLKESVSFQVGRVPPDFFVFVLKTIEIH